MTILIQAARIIVEDQLKENGGPFILQPGTVTRVKLATNNEVLAGGGLTEKSIPIFPVNKGVVFIGQCAIEADEPIVMRAVMDGPITGYIALPVYIEE